MIAGKYKNTTGIDSRRVGRVELGHLDVFPQSRCSGKLVYRRTVTLGRNRFDEYRCSRSNLPLTSINRAHGPRDPYSGVDAWEGVDGLLWTSTPKPFGGNPYAVGSSHGFTYNQLYTPLVSDLPQTLQGLATHREHY